jgi:hypothetical protein
MKQERKEWKMPKIKVGFRDGFSGDEAVITVDGKLVSRVPQLTSNPVISFAKNVEIELLTVPATVGVEVPSRHLSASAKVDSGTAYLAVFLLDNQLSLRPLQEDLPLM